jgi:hypothetical protein
MLIDALRASPGHAGVEPRLNRKNTTPDDSVEQSTPRAGKKSNTEAKAQVGRNRKERATGIEPA